MKAICNLCGKSIELSQDGRPPPWCPGCGADLKSSPLQIASSEVTAGPAPADEPDLKERFGKQTLAVGILLFLWGAAISAAPPQSGGDKVLR
jgi:hypothetical protein